MQYMKNYIRYISGRGITILSFNDLNTILHPWGMFNPILFKTQPTNLRGVSDFYYQRTCPRNYRKEDFHQIESK